LSFFSTYEWSIWDINACVCGFQYLISIASASKYETWIASFAIIHEQSKLNFLNAHKLKFQFNRIVFIAFTVSCWYQSSCCAPHLFFHYVAHAFPAVGILFSYFKMEKYFHRYMKLQCPIKRISSGNEIIYNLILLHLYWFLHDINVKIK
jgi:hypothetical protein